MTKALLASVALAAFTLAGCAKEEKMMKSEPAASETMMSKEAMEKEAMEKEAMEKEAMMAENSSGGDAMTDLCFSKGGTISEWPGEGGATKTCDLDGGQYRLDSLTSYEAFQ